MARMHSRKKGKSGSTRPIIEKSPEWVTHSKEEIEKIILKLAKAEHRPSHIGLVLRDTYGVPDIKKALGKSVSAVLKEQKLQTKIPEDLFYLLKKELMIRNHMEKNKKDKVSKRGLQLTESKIHRLVKYYKRKEVLSREW